MTAARLVIEITDPAGTGGPYGTGVYPVPIVPNGKGGRAWSLSTRAWEPGDPLDRWREPLHPWDGGLFVDRLRANPRTYAKGNCDSSYPGLLLWPPKINSVTMANASAPTKQVHFNGLTFFVDPGSRYMYYFDPATNTVTQDKDFGAGKAAVDAAVFNGELIVAMGETEKIYKRSTAGAWTQAGDATYATALGLVDNKLWRAETTNRISNCVSTPLTLTSWTPASPNQYYAGDSTWPVNGIIDYGGVPWVLKGDGAYAPDPQSRFKNQAPQLRRWPHTDNGKGAFVAQGALWVPSAAGLIRIKPGESKIFGPERTWRPTYRFWVRGGVEWGDSIYLLVNDEAAVEKSCIIKMQRDTEQYSPQDYRYYEWARLDGTTVGKSIGINPSGTNPKLVATYGANARYIDLGRGGGRDVDDANYNFGTDMVVESGPIAAGPDLTVMTLPIGVQVVAKLASTETLTIAGSVDGTAYSNLLDTQEGGGSAGIGNLTDYQAVARYFPSGTKGQFVEIKLTGTLTTAAGTTRPEVREAWVFGYNQPKVTDIISISVNAGDNVRLPNGAPSGMLHSDWQNLFRNWMTQGTELSIAFQDYEESHTTRFVVRSISSPAAVYGATGSKTEEFEQSTTLGPGYTADINSILNVHLARVDRAGAFAT